MLKLTLMTSGAVWLKSTSIACVLDEDGKTLVRFKTGSSITVREDVKTVSGLLNRLMLNVH